MDLGQRLKEARTRAGLTQEELGKQLGVSRQTIYNWENSRSTPDIASVIKLGKLYNMSLDKLLSGDEVIQQFQDLANRRRKFWQMMLEIGVILQLIGVLLRSLEIPFAGDVLIASGFLLVTVSIFMHLRVFDHSRGQILRGIAGVALHFILVLLARMLPQMGSMTINALNLVSALLILSAGVWTVDWKSTRLWLLIVLTIGTPFLMFLLMLKEMPTPVKDNPFRESYRVEEVLYPEDGSLGKHAKLQLTDFGIMRLALDGIHEETISSFQYLEPNVEDTEKHIWLCTPEEDPQTSYRLTREADDSLFLACSRNGQLQWKWRLMPDTLKGEILVPSTNTNFVIPFEWYPLEIALQAEPEPYLGKIYVQAATVTTITIANSNGATLELQEEYHHAGGVDHHTYTLVPAEDGTYPVELKPRYGMEEGQYAIYRIPFEEGEFQFALTFQDFPE